MTHPLLMTGPGGDYVTRFDVKGQGLIKTRTQQSAGHDSDAESSGNGSGYMAFKKPSQKPSKKPSRGWLPGRGKKANKPAVRWHQDHYEPTQPAALPATYVTPNATPSMKKDAQIGVPALQQHLATLQAIEHWLTSQQNEVDRLAAAQTMTEANLAHGPEQPTLRVIRWNGGTMKLPTPIASVTSLTHDLPDPSPCHTLAGTLTPQLTPEPTPEFTPERNDLHDQPQPNAQADENFNHDSRHPAIARLFADDARARRSARGLQGHGLRTRRGTDQKGLPDTGCEQSTLFGAVA